jgi:aspartate aminotransferase
MLKLNSCSSLLAKRNTSVPHRMNSVWSKVQMGPEDPILGVTVAFNKDTDPKKINLGVGAYRDDNGKPFILPSVREAEKRIFEAKMDHEYAPIAGIASFNKACQELQLGADSEIIQAKRAVTVQSLSGTGALRVGADFIARHIDLPAETKKTIFLPNPTWGNHNTIFQDSGFSLKNYRYYDEKTCGLDFKGFLDDVKAAPKNSFFLFHACAHNPTGVDPNMNQWAELSKVCKERGHYIFFDLAYQGFASGSPEKDVAPVRLFIKDGHNVSIAQSFAKNFGLYGERAGALTFLTANQKEAENLESQLKILIRPMYSNPPIGGARIVQTILADAKLNAQWRTEVASMAQRIQSMRSKLVENLKSLGSKKDWSHITSQIGMFSYTGLKPDQVEKMTKDFHIYLIKNGRISVAGITSQNVGHLALAMHEVTK